MPTAEDRYGAKADFLEASFGTAAKVADDHRVCNSYLKRNTLGDVGARQMAFSAGRQLAEARYRDVRRIAFEDAHRTGSGGLTMTLAERLDKVERGHIGHAAAMKWLGVESINYLVETVHANGSQMSGHRATPLAPETREVLRSVIRPHGQRSRRARPVFTSGPRTDS